MFKTGERVILVSNRECMFDLGSAGTVNHVFRNPEVHEIVEVTFDNPTFKCRLFAKQVLKETPKLKRIFSRKKKSKL